MNIIHSGAEGDYFPIELDNTQSVLTDYTEEELEALDRSLEREAHANQFVH